MDEQLNTKKQAEEGNPMPFQPDYADEDIVIIDNLKNLESPHPVRAEFNILCVCEEGKLFANLNDEKIEVNKNDIFVCPPNVVMSNIMVTPDFSYQALCVNNSTLRAFLHDNIEIWNQAIYMNKQHVFKIGQKYMQIGVKAHDLLRSVLKATANDEDKRYRKTMVAHLVSMQLNSLCDRLRQILKEKDNPKYSQSSMLFNRFLDLLQNSPIKHLTVEHYAKELCISSKYLTTICKTYSGKSAYAWISEATTSEITYYLRNTQLSIKEISYKVGFSNLSFFGKYVKEHLGCSPMEYRRKIRE
jgi:AraC family transcriptional activator of pobA